MAAIQALILLVYITVMIYILYKMREEVIEAKQEKTEAQLENKIFLEADTKALEASLSRQLRPLQLNIGQDVIVDLGKPGVQEADKLTTLPLTIQNKTTTYAIYVDWLQSYLTDVGGQARQILNAGLAQVTAQGNLVPPSEKFKAKFQILAKERVPIVQAESLLEDLEEGKTCEISLWLTLQFKTVSYPPTPLATIVATCPYLFRKPTPEEVKTWKSAQDARARKKKEKAEIKALAEEEALRRKQPWYRRL